MFKQINLQLFLTRHSNRILALMMLSLHAFLVWGEDISNHLSRSYFLCHYGLFLMWQPVWGQNQKISKSATAMVLGLGLVAFFLINWWLTAIWLSILFGLLGGRIFSDDAKNNRMVHLMAAVYLLSMLLLWVVPKLLDTRTELEASRYAAFYLLPLLPIAIFFIAHPARSHEQLPILDFFYTMLLTLLAFILVLSSYAVGTIQNVHYLQVIFITMFGLGFGLIALNLLWKPTTHFSGVELIMSRYLTSVGMPFERWVRNIAALGDIETSPRGFLEAAMREMQSLPWVAGVSWMTDEAAGKIGESTDHIAQFNFKDFHMSLNTRWEISPALYMHVKLLTQIMGEFYLAKRREETLRQNAYMQAFYETGSRLTHDIKNILQSTGTLVAAAEQSDEKDQEALLRLIRRQLPMLNQRIASTLDKLKAPSEEKLKLEKISAWWKDLQLRHRESNVEFVADELPRQEIKVEVLDSILDNLISNALEKAKYQPGTTIKVTVLNDEINGCRIEVTDSGKAMDAAVANDLFKKHIASHNGLGVGLYHAGKDAQQAGYELSLVNNINGDVRFRVNLAPKRAETD
ncbi:MAG TPA: ATP-binding protein [Methylophilus sp.]|nr:ATP-binding protein [Methylophilus sp.]HQQ32731.1 ATP-binding protein [Methylophilus sp.]